MLRLFPEVQVNEIHAIYDHRRPRRCCVIYIRDSIALRFEPFKRMYENRSKIALNSTCSKGLRKRSLP